MPATPAKTPAEVWAARKLAGGRISVALNEVLRRLKTELPPYIRYVNEQMGLTGADAIPVPKKYYVAPERILDEHINCVLVGASVAKEMRGTQNMTNNATLTVYVVNDRITSAEEVNSAWDRSDLVIQLLQQYMSGCKDPSGRWCWRALVPRNQEMLPEEWAEYSGVAIPYTLRQDPSDEVWIA